MPQVERVTQEFRDQGVQLIAVNLQETPKEITAMLERHKLDLTVALDRDGVVAEKYAANAIPQTVDHRPRRHRRPPLRRRRPALRRPAPRGAPGP